MPSFDIRCHHHTVLGLGLPGGQQIGRQLAAQLDLILNAAVLLEVPVKEVLVVDHRGNEAQDQHTRPAGLGMAVAVLHVLPQDPVVLLVHTDCFLHSKRLAIRVVEHPVKVMDVSEAVAAQLQRVGTEPQAVVAHVKGTLPCVAGVGVAVRHGHLHKRPSVHNAPSVVFDLVEDEPLAVVPAHPEAPLVPGHLAALHLEGRPVWLQRHVLVLQ
eukprot:scaffold35711_cov34-Prasinocladus_malaysianus.AAC.2